MRNLILIGTLALAACSNNPGQRVGEGVACSAPRPQVCTMEYAPVCANLMQGGSREYASACNACADDAVASYVAGACPSSE